ncbi:dienelactone hydrolase family protein [Pseudonocardia sp.]|uniref:dienelactone hydrolase family protein n=1 Tax=Pseudonocardia sp. TaxID=60912 RepID=UPI002605773E|nr:dienelactone hydrolase family protein [Pseudonocardia sp.]
MTEVVVFHHAQGCTPGVRAFADALRSDGHRVTVPDLYDGATFGTLEAGIAHAGEIGFGTLLERGRAAAETLPGAVVYAGFSLGVLPAQLLAQTRPGARGALLLHSCVPPAEFGPWPDGVRVQVHAMEGDALFVDGGDLAAARDLVDTVPGAELFRYPGTAHLFADAGLAGFDEPAATLMTQRVLAFLGEVR